MFVMRRRELYMKHNYAVIMAGGGGTRLWPLSRQNKPKQFLPLIGKETLFQTTVNRLIGIFPFESILVVTVDEQAEELQRQTPEIPKENFLLEPFPRGTASVVALAATVLYERDSEAIMTILPADHHIRNKDVFYHNLEVAQEVAMKEYLVTLGLTPTHPATGYGYIQGGGKLVDKFPSYPVYEVEAFKEKPDEDTALSMLNAGGFYWNSGMFVWRAEAILKEFSRQMPILYKGLLKIRDAIYSNQLESIINGVWDTVKSETIDYGIMENAEKVALVPATGLGWSDVGSWDSLFDVYIPDNMGNIVVGNTHIALDTHNSLVYGRGTSKRLIATIGVDDLVVVDTHDVLLICHKEQTQKVRDIVSRLKKSKNEHYL